ncbi:MAG: restriction endonuclease subunit S [Candidatus Onthomorpha sp.]|nr:restriction endonuclease subunit S [Bacteroidales bacterium]MDY5698509.1 restriction endonuclease subunit S [Candidatus Onthomorpha sp.]
MLLPLCRKRSDKRCRVQRLGRNYKIEVTNYIHNIATRGALRNSKRGAAIPHLNKELFYNLPIGIPPYQEQERIAQRIDALFQLLK